MYTARPHLGRSIAFRRSLKDSFLGTPDVRTLWSSPKACESPCYCQPKSTGENPHEGSPQIQNMCGTCRPQSGLLLMLSLWWYGEPASSRCMRRHTRRNHFLLRGLLNYCHDGSHECESRLRVCLCVCLCSTTARYSKASSSKLIVILMQVKNALKRGRGQCTHIKLTCFSASCYDNRIACQIIQNGNAHFAAYRFG